MMFFTLRLAKTDVTNRKSLLKRYHTGIKCIELPPFGRFCRAVGSSHYRQSMRFITGFGFMRSSPLASTPS